MAITRELEITYGSTVVGKGTNHLIDGPFRLTKGYESATVTFDVVVTGTSDSGFATSCSDLEIAYRTPRQRLTVKFNSSTHEDFDPASNTGFDAEPSISKAGSEHDTGRSRRYTCSVTVRLPADLTGQAGRLTSSVTLQKNDSGRRRMIITGTYTALTTNAARAQFEASIAGYATTLASAFGGTWEGPFDNQESANDTDKVLNFSRTYEELIFNQSVGTLDDLTLRRQRLLVTVQQESPSDAVIRQLSASRFKMIGVEYSAAVDKAQSTDLKNVYKDKVKPFLKQQALAAAGASDGAIIVHEPGLDLAENRINASMTVLVKGTSDTVQARISTDEAVSSGWEIVPVWSGDRMAADDFPGPQEINRTVTIVSTYLGLPDLGDGQDYYGNLLFRSIDDPIGGNADVAMFGFFPETGNSPDGGQLTKRLMGFNRSASPRTIGDPADSIIQVYDDVLVARYRYFVRIRSASVPGQGSSTSGSGLTVSP